MPSGAGDGPPERSKKKCQRACKPGSVQRRVATANGRPFLLGTDRSVPPATNPGGEPEQAQNAAPIRSCTRWGLPCRGRCRRARCALAAPFRPYRSEDRRFAFCGTGPDPACARPPGVTRHRCSVEPGLSSPPAFAEAAAARPFGSANMGYCGRGSNSASSFARHSPSMMPSIRSGRKRRWKAITAFCGSVTS